MIELKELKHDDVGRYVIYDDGLGNQQRGRLKSWGARSVFVVFSCLGNWDNYQDYIGESCDPNDLTFEK